MKLTVLIRYANHADTLASTLEALRHQTRQPDELIGLNNASNDGSTALLLNAGARILDWPDPYQPARVLNFGMAHCKTELVLILSAHMTLVSPDAIERLVAAVCEAGVACASHHWDAGVWGRAVDWHDLQRLGMPYSSIYTNVCGMLRTAAWVRFPFNPGAGVVDDYDWVLEQLRQGASCRRIDLEFRYERRGPIRYFLFTRHVRALAHIYGLRLAEVTCSYAAQQMLEGAALVFKCPARWKTAYAIWRHGFQIMMGRLTWLPLASRIKAGKAVAAGSIALRP